MSHASHYRMPISLGMIFFIPVSEITQVTVSYYDQTKYEDKLLVWIAILLSVIFNGYIVSSKMATNQKVHLEECLMKRLLPFIKKYSNDWYVFWPDMASSHYARSVQTWLQNNKIPYISKTMNIANVSEIQLQILGDFSNEMCTRMFGKHKI